MIAGEQHGAAFYDPISAAPAALQQNKDPVSARCCTPALKSSTHYHSSGTNMLWFIAPQTLFLINPFLHQLSFHQRQHPRSRPPAHGWAQAVFPVHEAISLFGTAPAPQVRVCAARAHLKGCPASEQRSM